MCRACFSKSSLLWESSLCHAFLQRNHFWFRLCWLALYPHSFPCYFSDTKFAFHCPDPCAWYSCYKENIAFSSALHGPWPHTCKVHAQRRLHWWSAGAYRVLLAARIACPQPSCHTYPFWIDAVLLIFSFSNTAYVPCVQELQCCHNGHKQWFKQVWRMGNHLCLRTHESQM